MIHVRTAYIDPGHGPERQFEIAACGYPDVSPLQMLDPVAFGASGITHGGRLLSGYCIECAAAVTGWSRAACERSNKWAAPPAQPAPAPPGPVPAYVARALETATLPNDRPLSAYLGTALDDLRSGEPLLDRAAWRGVLTCWQLMAERLERIKATPL